MLTTVQILQLGATLISGGAVGALITTAVTKHRARIQPVGRRITVVPVFRTGEPKSSLRAKVSIEHAGSSFPFDNLFIITLELVNRGNQDVAEFPFGLTFQNGDRAIHVDSESGDRHHQCDALTDVSPSQPKSELDYVLRPFNRGDLYQFTIYAVAPSDSTELSDILVSSPQPVRFINIPTVRELLAAAAEETIVSAPFIMLKIRR